MMPHVRKWQNISMEQQECKHLQSWPCCFYFLLPSPLHPSTLPITTPKHPTSLALLIQSPPMLFPSFAYFDLAMPLLSPHLYYPFKLVQYPWKFSWKTIHYRAIWQLKYWFESLLRKSFKFIVIQHWNMYICWHIRAFIMKFRKTKMTNLKFF